MKIPIPYCILQRASDGLEEGWAAGLLLEEWTPSGNGLVLEGAAATLLQVGTAVL